MIEFIKFADFYKRMRFHKHPGRISGNEADRDLADSIQPYYVTYSPDATYSCPDTFYITKVIKERIWEYRGCDAEGNNHYCLSKIEHETYSGVIKIQKKMNYDGWYISFIEVRGDYRRKGLAKELINEMIAFFARNNVKKIWRSTPSPEGEKFTANYISEKLYEIGCEFEFV